jgi:hypothetical protein
VLEAEFLGEAESSRFIEQVFGRRSESERGLSVESGLVALLRIHNYRLGGIAD